MKLCIPTMDDKGLQAVPSAHFGSAPFFTFVDTDTGEVEAQRNGGDHHAHGACRPLDFLGTRSVDAIVCRGLGRRAFSRLESGGVAVYVSLEKDVEATVAAFKDGRLRHLTSEEACPGHDHGHGHGHAHGHGQSPGLGQGRGQRGGFGYGGQA
jgi:predicted Fe-Mo cluster-binding NifX family protein